MPSRITQVKLLVICSATEVAVGVLTKKIIVVCADICGDRATPSGVDF